MRFEIFDLRFAIGLMLAIATIGCERQDLPTESPATPPRAIEGNGIIRGRVLFGSTLPVMQVIPNQPCHSEAGPLTEETVIVNGNGTLRNVFVFVRGVGPEEGLSRAPALLDQVDCQYTPHVVGVQVGQTLRVKSSDPTMHNVHYNPRQNRPGNFGLTEAGSEKSVTFGRPEFIRVKCDVHPWMLAYIGVFENSLFAITGDEGTFEITGVPDGEYELFAWHEMYGEQTTKVNVSATKPVETQFEYKAP